MKINSKFDIFDKIYIPEISRDGKIIAIWITSLALEYKVKYFHNGDVKEAYFLEDELISKPKNKNNHKMGIGQ